MQRQPSCASPSTHALSLILLDGLYMHRRHLPTPNPFTDHEWWGRVEVWKGGGRKEECGEEGREGGRVEPENEGKEGGEAGGHRSNLGRERGLGEDAGAGVRKTRANLLNTTDTRQPTQHDRHAPTYSTRKHHAHICFTEHEV